MPPASRSGRAVGNLRAYCECVSSHLQVHTIVPHEQGAQLLLLGHRRIQQTGLMDRDPLRLSILHLKDQVGGCQA